MVLRPTVLIVGAGASHAYDLPLGRDLGQRIANHTRVEEPLWVRLMHAGANGARLDALGRDYLRSGRDSLDAFLDTRRDLLAEGKLAIAGEMLASENRSYLERPEDGREDWLGYLLNRLWTQSRSDLRLNQLVIVTFNFDRCIEQRVGGAIAANYGLSDADAQAVADFLPVLHVNGSLGPLAGPNAVPFACCGGNVAALSTEQLTAAAAGIRIVHEESDKRVLADARVAIARAQRIYFAGFSYHELNVERLGLSRANADAFIGKKVIGTAFGLSTGERAYVERRLPERGFNLASPSWTLLQLLREEGFASDE